MEKITYLCIQSPVYSNKSQETWKKTNEKYLEAKEKQLESHDVRLEREMEIWGNWVEGESENQCVERESSCGKWYGKDEKIKKIEIF